MRTRRRVLAATALSISGVVGCLDDGLDELPGMGGREETEQQDQRHEILLGYEDALEQRNDGIETRDGGIDLFNAEEYADAVDEIETARDRFAAAADGFETAADAAAEIDSDDPDVEEARGICLDAAENARIQVEATEAGLAATTAAADGEAAGMINDHIMTYQGLVEEAEAIPVADGDKLADVLGF